MAPRRIVAFFIQGSPFSWGRDTGEYAELPRMFQEILSKRLYR
jgi:hypothetical protein